MAPQRYICRLYEVIVTLFQMKSFYLLISKGVGTTKSYRSCAVAVWHLRQIKNQVFPPFALQGLQRNLDKIHENRVPVSARMSSLTGACSGCGCLHTFKLQCPAMHTLVGTFCNKLSDDTMAEAVKGASGICSLNLSVCLSLGDKGLAALGSLRSLRLLDISYTFVEVRCCVTICSHAL